MKSQTFYLNKIRRDSFRFQWIRIFRLTKSNLDYLNSGKPSSGVKGSFVALLPSSSCCVRGRFAPSRIVSAGRSCGRGHMQSIALAQMLRGLKAILESYKEKDIIRAYQVGCGLCAVLVFAVTTYDIHRSIKVNDTPPSREQLESLAATIDGSRRANQSPDVEELGQNEKSSSENFNEDIAEGVKVLGLISDTHGVLEESTILALRQATSTVIHAGDVGDSRHKSRLSAEKVIQMLEEGTEKEIIPVAGNVDEGLTDLPAKQALEVGGKKIVVIHISGYPPNDTEESRELVRLESADIVIFGHSHVPGVAKHGKTIYINPGSAGPRRFRLPRCIAFLSIYPSGEVLVEFRPVGDLPQDDNSLPKSFRDPATSKVDASVADGKLDARRRKRKIARRTALEVPRDKIRTLSKATKVGRETVNP